MQVMDKDFVLPLGKAKVMRQGKDITITSYSKMLGFSLQAAEQLAKEGIDCEVRWGDWLVGHQVESCTQRNMAYSCSAA